MKKYFFFTAVISIFILLSCSPDVGSSDYYGKKANKSYQSGDYSRAVKYYGMALEYDSSSFDNWYNKGLAYASLNKYTDALTSFDYALNLKPNEVEALYAKAYCYYFMKDYDSAIKYYDKALLVVPDYKDVYLLKGNIYFHQNKYNEALELYIKALEANKNNYMVLYNIAMTSAMLDDKPMMLEYLKKAIRANKDMKRQAYKDRAFDKYGDDEDFLKLIK